MTNSMYNPIIKKLTAQEFTRPSDTTPYTIGDVVGPVTTPALQVFTVVGKYSKGGIVIRDIRLAKSTTTVTNATFGIAFYNSSTVAAVADNTAWSQLYADREKFLGRRDLTIMTAGSGSAVGLMDKSKGDLHIQLADNKLYCVVIAQAAYTPASAETFSLSLTIEQIN